jgi:hypothetical protein
MSLIPVSSVSRTPTKSSKRTAIIRKEKLLPVLIAGGMLFDTWMDAQFSLHGIDAVDTSIPGWLATAGIIIGITLFQEKILRVFCRAKKEVSCSDQIKPTILTQWSEVQKSLGINSLETEANIQRFPVELEQLQALHAAREGLSGKKNRQKRAELDKRIRDIMVEALDPLAHKLRYIAAGNERVRTMIMRADTDLDNTLREIRGRMAHETALAQADHLLRST